MSVVISSYQQKRSLHRLLAALRVQLLQDADLARTVEITVVIDGSTDGSEKVAAKFSHYPVPLRFILQAHQGLAAARNMGLKAANGDVVLFLDDDMVPSEGLLARHLRTHEVGTNHAHVVVGPCIIPPTVPALPATRSYYDRLYRKLTLSRCVRRFDEFSAANTSGPTELFREAGGFDERFTGYGLEDWDLGVRLLDAAVRIDFDREAVAWHLQRVSVRRMCEEQRSAGRNLVRMLTLHPELEDSLASRAGRSLSRSPQLRRWALRLLRTPGAQSSRVYAAVSVVAGLAASLETVLRQGERRRFLQLALFTANLAGVVEEDRGGQVLARRLGNG